MLTTLGLTPMERRELIAKRLREQRKAASLTQAELAERAGLPQASISNWEKGKAAISFEDLAAIAAVLGVTTDSFLEDAEPEPEEPPPTNRRRKPSGE